MLSLIFFKNNFRNIVLYQKSPVHTLSESRRGTLSVTHTAEEEQDKTSPF